MNETSFLNIFSNLEKYPKTNFKSLQESLLNKVLRRAFDKWTEIKKFKVNGRMEHHESFFVFHFKEMADHISVKEKKNKKDVLNELISKLINKSQMQRKKRKKNIKKMKTRKCKFMNLVLRTEQICILKDLKNFSLIFNKSFEEIKEETFNEYHCLENNHLVQF